MEPVIFHADEMTARFEAYEPADGDERPVEEYLLDRAVLDRAHGERRIAEAVASARAKGIPWKRIGEILGTSTQAAQQRYGAIVESA